MWKQYWAQFGYVGTHNAEQQTPCTTMCAHCWASSPTSILPKKQPLQQQPYSCCSLSTNALPSHTMHLAHHLHANVEAQSTRRSVSHFVTDPGRILLPGTSSSLTHHHRTRYPHHPQQPACSDSAHSTCRCVFSSSEWKSRGTCNAVGRRAGSWYCFQQLSNPTVAGEARWTTWEKANKHTFFVLPCFFPSGEGKEKAEGKKYLPCSLNSLCPSYCSLLPNTGTLEPQH